jgi:hypothetical protein
VIAKVTMLTSSPVLANGVLQFRTEEGVTLRVLATDGSEVVGDFVEPGIWRPHEPFAVGNYVADLTYEEQPERVMDRAFEVIESQAPNFDFIAIQVTPSVRAGSIAETACCKEGEAKVGGVPCSERCEPLCVTVAYAAEQFVEVYYARDSADPQADQTVLSPLDALAPGHFNEGNWAVDGEPNELCGALEVFSWLDLSTHVLSACIANPKPELGVIDASPVFGAVAECTIPPEGFEQPWCSAHAYACEVEVLGSDMTAQEQLLAACAHYYVACNRPLPQVVDQPISEQPPDSGPRQDAAGMGGSPQPVQAANGSNDGGCALGVRNQAPRSTLVALALAALGVACSRRWTSTCER